MIISADDKRRLLIQRGFTADEIETGLEDYLNGSKEWNIRTINPEELVQTEDLEDLAKLFRKDSIEQVRCSTYWGSDFGQYASIHENSKGPQVNAPILEPYVARLVLAINECCINTSMSCDGWHKNMGGSHREITIWMADVYSAVWFWIIAEFVFGEKWPERNPNYGDWTGIFEPDNNPDRVASGETCKVVYRIADGNEADAYHKIDRYAAFFEKHAKEFRETREKWMAVLRKRMSDAEVSEQRFLGLRRCISEAVQPDLTRLAESWKHADLEQEGIQAWEFAENRYLNCPYEDKDAVKALGAKYDGKRKAWYINWDTDPEPFERWLLPDSSQR